MEELNVQVNQQEVDDIIRKIEKLNQLLKEANSLINELASVKLIKINVEL